MKQKTCRVCKERFDPVRFAQVVCMPPKDCVFEYANKKTAAKIKKQNAKQKREFKTNDLSHQKKLTQDVFNKLRRLQEFKWFRDRGMEPECISCGKTKMDWCCGHFKTVGSSGVLRFSGKNTYLQCNKNCNSSRSGNIHGNNAERGFIKGLKERFGEGQGEEIIDWCERNQAEIKKWSGTELIEMRKDFNKQIRELEK